jgi:hypothetical protein
MRANEFIHEDVSRRGFLRGMGAAAAAAVPGVASAIDKSKHSAAQARYWERQSSGDDGSNSTLISWRMDPRTHRLESMPTTFNPDVVSRYLKLYKVCKDSKLLPAIPAELWAMILLVEGRSDFGFNNMENMIFTTQPTINPKTGEWVDGGEVKDPFVVALKNKGMNSHSINFCRLLRDKISKSKRLGIPFYQAWQGSTKYLDRFNAQAEALKSPKNKQFLDFIQSNIS